jgi:signal transduction histidine kinase
MWCLRATLILLPVLLSPAAPVARVGAQPLPMLDEYHVRVFTSADGLLQADVRGAQQTPDGYLYVAGGRGLLRFDGHAFVTVPLAGAPSRFIEWLLQDAHGRLWLFLRGGQAGFYQHGEFRLVSGTGRVQPPVWDLPDGSTWLRTDGALLRVRADATIDTFTAAPGPRGTGVQGVWEISGLSTMVATAQDLTRLVSNADGTVRHERTDPAAALGERPGLTRVPSSTTRLLEHLVPAGDAFAGRVLMLIYTAREGTRWLTLRSGERDLLVRLRDGREEIIPLEAHVGSVAIQDITEDHEGSLWLSTDRGLIQLTPRRVHALRQRHGLAEPFTAPVLQTRDGAVWVGTWGGGVHRFAAGRLSARYTMADGLPEDRVRSLFEDDDGTVWVGGNLGFAAIRDGRIVFRSPPTAEVRDFARAPDGSLWIATSTSLLHGTGREFRELHAGFWRDIWALHSTPDGALWVGSESGLHRVLGDSIHSFTENDGLRSTFVVGIHEEADGTLWFSTYEHGLHRYRNGRFVAVTTSEGLHHDGVWSMLADDAGHIWMSSDFGVFRVPRRQLHAVADALERGDPHVPRLEPLVFTEAHGMPNRESNRAAPAAWRLADGRLVFNNVAGLAIIDPEHAALAAPPPRVLVRELLADGARVDAASAGAGRVPRGTRHLAFEFGAVTFLTPDLTSYRYRILGYDPDWVENGGQRRATYSRLPPGRYTFEVQSRTGASPWSEPGAAYSFIVPPALLQTWWLRLLLALAAGAALTAAYRYRVRWLLDMERMRLRIAADLHDDVGSNLSSIALLSEMLQQRQRRDELELRQIQRISDAAGETMGALRDIIWVVDPKHGSIQELVRRMRSVAADMLNGTTSDFRVAVTDATSPISMTLLRSTFLIYKEALHNITRHAAASHVDISVTSAAGILELTIEDDGVGFDGAVRPDGRGLENMRRRALQAGGTIELLSGGRRGTRIVFRAPMA